MPKDEFDFDDPMELNGVGLVTDHDTTDSMCECFIEEFMRMGYDHRQVLALFKTPNYIGMNMVLQNRGEAFVKQKISEIFRCWGKTAEWPADSSRPEVSEPTTKPAPPSAADIVSATESVGQETECTATDPMGAPVPKLNL